MNVTEFIARLSAERGYRGQIAAEHSEPARPARFAAPAVPLPPALDGWLRALGVERLYLHQAAAYDAARRGEDLLICTSTASGKSLCFHLPVLAGLHGDPDARALYVFPAKALAYDQLGGLERSIAAAELSEAIRPACYDGDTPSHKRGAVRRNANLLLTNPDMLHVGILPYHARWAGFFSRLRFVVLDEIHVYRGIFGSHVAGVVRRLERICRHYGSTPQFICSSATLGNPRELAERLVGRPMRLIDEDGSPRGARHYLLWNPPWLGDARVARRSANVEAQELVRRLLEAGAGTIAFTKARVVAELIHKYLVEELRRRRPDLVGRISAYRGGYLPNERREIERALFSGELLGVCCTNALELGIDVGSLDAAVVVGFPGTFCSFFQQVGRAGRRQDDALAILVAYDDPVDQFLARRPERLFRGALEHAVIDPGNPHILRNQLACAAFELSLSPEELPSFGAVAEPVTRALAEEQRLRETGGRFYWSSRDVPATQVNLRTIGNATYSIVDVTDARNTVLGQVDSISAPELVYPQAVYLHAGESYIVRSLDESARVARVERFDADYYTQPLLASAIHVEAPDLEAPLLDGRKAYGPAVVRWQTTGFRKIKFHTMELIGQTAQELPAQEVHTMALWLQPPPPVLRGLSKTGLQRGEALAGARNVLTVVLPALAMADRYDIGGIVDSSQVGRPTIFLYDRFEGGVGYARCGFERSDELLRLALELVAGCDCEDGCPGCVAPTNLRVPIHHDPDLQQGSRAPDKAAVLALLRAWVG